MRSKQALEAFYDALADDDAEVLYDRAPCGYLSTTPDGTIIKVNQTLLSLTGYARSDLVGKRTFASLLTAGGRIYHETHYAPLLRMSGKAREIALELVTADGQRLPVLVNATLDDEQGRPPVIRAAVFDATERRSYERELLRAKERAEESEARARALAQTLQQTLIPPTPPSIPGLEIAAAYRPAGDGHEVGGDFYDIFEIGRDDWLIALGDVSGKGTEAAVVTALVRHTIRAAVVAVSALDSALTIVNEALLRHPSERFATLVLLRLTRSPDGWLATVVAGGHPLPLLIESSGDARWLGRPGTAVGLVEQPRFEVVETMLEPGQTVLMFTDGVTEGRRGVEFYGEGRLVAEAAVHTGSPHTLTAALLADLLDFQQQSPRDDVALVAVRVPA